MWTHIYLSEILIASTKKHIKLTKYHCNQAKQSSKPVTQYKYTGRPT